jgi:hypothetical protein
MEEYALTHWVHSLVVVYQVTDACSSNPCINKSTCVIDSTKNFIWFVKNFWWSVFGIALTNNFFLFYFFSSICSDKFSGINCEKNKTWCQPNPCLNNGICSDLASGAGFTCACPAGVFGNNCENIAQGRNNALFIPSIFI